MLGSATGRVVLALAIAGALMCPMFASAQTQQVLDRLATFGTQTARQMAFDKAPSARPPDSTGLYVTPGVGLSACEITARGEFTCLDGRDVRNWLTPNRAPLPGQPEDEETLFTCANPALGLDAKKANTCTGLTVDLEGAIWIAGKKANSHSLIKVTPAPCTGGQDPLTNMRDDLYPQDQDLCWESYAAGRPLLEEISSVGGDLGEEFQWGPGVSGVETRSSIVYFADDPSTAPHVVASGKAQLGLTGSEQVLSASILQLAPDNFVFVYTTTTGRVMAVNTPATPTSARTPVEVFRVTTDRRSSTPPASCLPTSTTDHFEVRTSSKSGRVYVTDRRFCRVVALQPTAATNALGFALANVLERETPTSPQTELTLSTGTLQPDSLSVSPGIVIDLSECGTGMNCPLVSTPDGAVAANMSGVVLQNPDATNLTLFQVKDLPDCRYILAGDPDDVRCAGKEDSVVSPSSGPDVPERQYLDLSKLLPKEITDLFPGFGPPPALPGMLVSPRVSGQAPRYEFDAFVGLPADGVEFQGVFELRIDVAALADASLGCTDVDPPAGTVDLARYLRQWDVTSTVSERFQTFGADGIDHYDTLANFGCGSSRDAGGRWSVYAYNLATTADTFALMGGSWYRSVNDDAVFARLLDGLYEELGDTVRSFVCGVPPEVLPEVTTPPVSGSVCSTLEAEWDNGRDKLTKCIAASTQPKDSAGAQNCTAFRSQLNGYRSTLESLPAAAPGVDIANRIGEAKARARVVSYVFEQRFLPSIPPGGFCENPTLPACNMIPVP